MYVAMHSVIFASTVVVHLCLSTSVVAVLLYIAILCVSVHVTQGQIQEQFRGEALTLLLT